MRGIPSALLYLLPLTILSSCLADHFYAETAEIVDQSWQYVDTLEYSFDIQDTTTRYDIGLTIKHSDEYAFQNLYVKIFTVFPDGKNLAQTLPIDFADHTGKWYGVCSGDICTLEVILQENAIFNQMGMHHFKIAQFMRVDPVIGIESIGLFLDQKD
ncbi:MAG: gliding motility lipoprotein GldH [Saprospiraceae bacterium]|nr:gliding motility lipoprotein GldH [Saprospiraceae bacterium]